MNHILVGDIILFLKNIIEIINVDGSVSNYDISEHIRSEAIYGKTSCKCGV